MKILFVSRAYPPTIGGIENQNFELSVWLAKYAEVETIANKKGKKFLPIFLPLALIKVLFKIKKYDALLLGDGVLGIIGWIIKKIYPQKKVVCVVHGLDLTFKMKLYSKLWVKKFIKSLDLLIAVGNETVKVAIKKGIPKEKVIFIPNGVDTEKFIGTHSKEELVEILNEDIKGKSILLTSGRLAKRKGVAWFIENVIPKLNENIIYIVAGDGPDKENIESAIKKTNSEKRVRMLGYVSDKHRNILLNTCDIFIQPNIKIEGDMEGFGISVIEASSCKLPVVASKLEGLQDAIKDNQNGFLIEPCDAEAYAQKIQSLLSDDMERKNFGEKSRRFVVDNYKWENIAKQYIEEIHKIISK